MKMQTAGSVVHNCILLCIHSIHWSNTSHPVTWPQHRQSQTCAAREARNVTRGPGSRKLFWGTCIYIRYTNTLSQPGLQAALKVPRPQMCSLANYRMLCELGGGEDKFLKSFCCAIQKPSGKAKKAFPAPKSLNVSSQDKQKVRGKPVILFTFLSTGNWDTKEKFMVTPESFGSLNRWCQVSQVLEQCFSPER